MVGQGRDLKSPGTAAIRGQIEDASWSEEGESLVLWGGIVDSFPGRDRSSDNSGYDAGRVVMDNDIGHDNVNAPQESKKGRS
jgi:hypothetical protein